VIGYTTRTPPPVILPGAAGAALRLAGALRRASPFGLALPPAVLEGPGMSIFWTQSRCARETIDST
jgi:hypothetical protein